MFAQVQTRQIRTLLERLHGAQQRLEDPEPWMVLNPRIPAVWEGIIRGAVEDLDNPAIGSVVSLANTQGKYGTIEACKLIYHILKDRSSGSFRPSNSWLVSSIGEARQALRNQQKWDGSKGG